MLPSSRIELAIYRYIKSHGTKGSVTIGLLARDIQQSTEEVAERLRYLYSEGHVLMWKFVGPKRLGYSEEGNVLFSAKDFPYKGEFQVEITPSGRRYFEELEAQEAGEQAQNGSPKGNAMPKAKRLTFETAFHSYHPEGPPRQGGAGVVLRVRNEAGDLWAIKRIDPRKATSQNKKRFKNEIDFCKNEKHKNIVKILDEGFTTADGEKSLFYVMPFFPKTLRDLMTERMPHQEILPLLCPGVGWRRGCSFAGSVAPRP